MKSAETARFKVPDSGCDNAYPISKGIMLASDPACKGSYPRRKAREAKTKRIFERRVEALK